MKRNFDKQVMLAQALSSETSTEVLDAIVTAISDNENIFIAVARNPSTSVKTISQIACRYANYVIENPILPLLALEGKFDELDSILLSHDGSESYMSWMPTIHHIHELPEWLENYIKSGFSKNTYLLAYWAKLSACSADFNIWCQEKQYDISPFGI